MDGTSDEKWRLTGLRRAALVDKEMTADRSRGRDDSSEMLHAQVVVVAKSLLDPVTNAWGLVT